MSKEIAQTVGGKRIAWLLAILAAFAVMATLASQWRSSEAAFPTISAAVTLDDTTPAPGQTVSYTVAFTVSGTSAAVAISDILELQFDADLLAPADVSADVFGTGSGATCAVDAANELTCDGLAAGNYASGNIVVSFTWPYAGQTVAAPTGNKAGGACAVDVTSVICDTSAIPATITAANAVSVSPTSATNLLGDAETYTFSLPAGITCASDDTAGAVRTCAVSDVNLGAGLTLVSGPTIADTALGNATTVTVTVINNGVVNPGGTISLDVSTGEAGTDFISQQATKTYVAAELRHIPDSVANNTSTVIPRRDIETNVRNSRHTICTVQQDTGIDLNADGDAIDSGTDILAVPVQLPGITLANIVVTNGGGYASTIDTDPTFSDVRVFVGDGTATGLPTSTTTAGLFGATCVSWVSLDAGDQSISIIYVGDDDGANYSAHWDTNGDANDNNGATNGTPNTTLVKEWNRLEDSTLTLSGGATGFVTGTGATGTMSKNIGVVLDPATGLYKFNNVTVSDVFRGSHTNSAGAKEGPFALAGVNWTADLAPGSCGLLNGSAADASTTTVIASGVTTLDTAGQVVSPSLTFSAGTITENCGPGRTATINFVGSEPGPLGSGTGIIVTESVTFTFTTEVAAKQVFLAWAGQRVILEHDWRQPAGDVDGGTGDVDPDPLGTCPFNLGTDNDDFTVRYIKGSGPGNFLPSLGATISGNDQADVVVDADDDSQSDGEDIIGGPNGSCISRVLFESEDQGQVDIEAFVNTGNFNVTKHAFVIYYMKINTINVSLATQVSKPSHNSSSRTVTTQGGAADAVHLADWAPGNPWDASKDDADNATEWNVSKDLLVRGRVTGWFVNSNPSGRARDDSNPLNVLPADRWVMPNDWPLLAGGPADPADGTDAIGTAEQFRPYYDIMFAPNNTANLYLANPEGTLATQVTTVATGNTGTGAAAVAGPPAVAAKPMLVTSCTNLTAGTTVTVGTGTTVFVVATCSGGLLTFTGTGTTTAPAAGTPIFVVSGVPFEGPFSLLDIKGLAGQGKGGAALSNFDDNNIRDTSLGDGDVDMWDAPMPPAPVSVQIRGTGFIKEVIKDEVYYLGTANSAAQVYPNPFYISNIPDSPFIPAIVVGGGYFWDSWGSDGPGGLGQGVYRFWTPAIIGTNSAGVGDALSATDVAELGIIRAAYGDNTIARDLVVYSDNHGEFMVAANGDFKTVLTACQTNTLAGGKHCATGDKVGTGTITATVDYPDFRGKHFPVLSNAATVDWTWGGYKDVTVEDGETDQYKYIVFHAMDRDGFCSAGTTGAVLLHSVLTSEDAKYDFSSLLARYNGDPNENVDFLIDSGEGIIIGSSSGAGTPPINDGKQFATGVTTYSWAANNPAVTGILEFDLSPLAEAGATDECQAWIKVSNSLLGVLNVLTIAHDDEGNIGFDRVIDLTNTHSYSLSFRWSLITWIGADAISVNDAITGTGDAGKNPGGNDISASVTAIYGWDAAAQQWLGFFPSGVNVPGANDLTSLSTGDAYWIAITGPSSVTWTIASNVN